MQKYIVFIIALLLALPMVAETNYTLVIDAGHGGKDPGAVGKFSKEKDLNLKLALAVGKLINEQYPDVKVVYTRSTDVFIPLQERADIANKNNADLFMSIHTNSSESKDPKGVETFILGTEKMDKNLDVAMRENAVIKLEADYKTTYQGFDPNSIDSYIMFELMQNSYMDQSLQFAEQVQQRFVGHLNREDRGVRQAAFWVLLKTACPSILFEMGFISNPEEEKFLNQNASIAQMANALVNAFGAYTHKQAVKKETLSIEKDKPEQPQVNQNQTNETQLRQNRDGLTSELSTVQNQPVTYYAVQICASKTPLEPNDERLKGQQCESIQVGEWHKYYTAADTDRNKVAEAQKRLKALFPDCWIIKFEK
ncbi:MAG: N-acetylmuramoyl-L-alanine amidase [Paludibacteraceae bacterium]|nr:N-acetylmuramoyl-L-alanine amidase [Paludibacteraceae bacterium]